MERRNQPAGHTGRQQSTLQKLQQLQSRNKTELLECLSEEQKEKLEKYCDTTLEMNSVSEREAFASGFRIALRLACAALADKTNE